MKILVIGSGGREHALAWKLSQSSRVKKIFIAPGNAGTADHGENVPIKADEIEKLKRFALKEGMDLTIVGPELPLSLGIVGAFEGVGLKIFGPSKEAAAIETSKVFSKEFMARHNIPAAGFRKFTDPEEAKSYAGTLEARDIPLVVKADGLAGGKGVFVCNSMDEAFLAINLMMKEKIFGEAGNCVILEEFLTGEEASFIAITDGKTVIPLATTQDHKPIYDGDKGPNTGGMGAYSPAPVVTEEVEEEIMNAIILPAVKAMGDEDRPYKGFLYAGVMIKDGKPKALEFNCRLGDPEAQALLMRLKSDLSRVISAAADGRLDEIELDWDERSSVCVVMASEGYPEGYEKGKEIRGLDGVAGTEDVMVFHAGTKREDGRIITDGGRVLGVTGLGNGIKEAIEKTYRAVEKISWEGAYYRKDIGVKALRKESP
ncbi:MAG: phosphoribosylamine--glycine ligase [Deltaproteobacteria bacterium]|nr:phosphoribosylamine--glycine ligase [Deltaproteobacteria bacterium]